MSIKRAWVNQDGDSYSISIRLHPGSLPLHISTHEFPPTDEVGGQRLNIDQAKEMGLVETHHSIHLFDRHELVYLKSVIEMALGD